MQIKIYRDLEEKTETCSACFDISGTEKQSLELLQKFSDACMRNNKKPEEVIEHYIRNYIQISVLQAEKEKISCTQ